MKKIVSFAVLALLGLTKVSASFYPQEATLSIAAGAATVETTTHVLEASRVKSKVTKASQVHTTKQFAADEAAEAFAKAHPQKKDRKRKDRDTESCEQDSDCSGGYFCDFIEEDAAWGVCKKGTRKVATKLPKRGPKTADCVTKGDKCETSKTCEIDQLCLADSEDEGFCYHKTCNSAVDVKQTKKVDCITKGDKCEDSRRCELNQLCLADSEDDGYCYHKDCQFDMDLKVKKEPVTVEEGTTPVVEEPECPCAQALLDKKAAEKEAKKAAKKQGKGGCSKKDIKKGKCTEQPVAEVIATSPETATDTPVVEETLPEGDATTQTETATEDIPVLKDKKADKKAKKAEKKAGKKDKKKDKKQK